MAEPLLVEVRRNGTVEAIHRVHAVAVRGGEVIEAAGDPALTCFMRSSSKPLQALPLMRARDDLPDDELAIACASHHDTPEQVAAVRALLARAEATEDDLELGPQEGRPPGRIHNNCSGNHAGMLALCRARGWPTQGYRLPEHPVQQACRDVHAEAAEIEPDELGAGTDGCGIVTFALTLERMAHAFSRLESLPGGDRIASAMRARPGPGRRPRRRRLPADARCARLARERRRRGTPLRGRPGRARRRRSRREDGASRAHGPALAAFLGRLGVDLPDLAERPVLNTRGERVGEIVTGR